MFNENHSYSIQGELPARDGLRALFGLRYGSSLRRSEVGRALHGLAYERFHELPRRKRAHERRSLAHQELH